jgi:hypothetical protein
MELSKLEAEIKEVKGLLVDIERPSTKAIVSLYAIDTLRKGLTNRFKSLLITKEMYEIRAKKEALAKKVDNHIPLNEHSQCNSTQDRPPRITTFYRENPSSSLAQEGQESPS